MRCPKIIFLLIFFFSSFNGSAQTFYKTPSGEKYHLSSCRMVKNVSEEISAAHAKELGLQPCKICNPENIYGSGNGPKPTQGESPTTVQCKGMTKAGTRCKHMTSIGNGYCYQHQP